MQWVLVIVHATVEEVEVKGPWDSQQEAIRFGRGYARGLKRQNPRKKYRFAVAPIVPAVYFDPGEQN